MCSKGLSPLQHVNSFTVCIQENHCAIPWWIKVKVWKLKPIPNVWFVKVVAHILVVFWVKFLLKGFTTQLAYVYIAECNLSINANTKANAKLFELIYVTLWVIWRKESWFNLIQKWHWFKWLYSFLFSPKIKYCAQLYCISFPCMHYIRCFCHILTQKICI